MARGQGPNGQGQGPKRPVCQLAPAGRSGFIPICARVLEPARYSPAIFMRSMSTEPTVLPPRV